MPCIASCSTGMAAMVGIPGFAGLRRMAGGLRRMAANQFLGELVALAVGLRGCACARAVH
jgi:hypothetical protein